MVALVGGLSAPTAKALITAPVTIDAPPASIAELGGTATASDGTGGLIYVKTVEGVRHVFVSRYVGEEWGPSLRVDRENEFEASEPRLAAGPRGELLAVWAAPVATIHGKRRWALFSARLGRGASGFAPAKIIDPNLGEGKGVDPSLARVSPGQAVVAYRVVTFVFDPGSNNPGKVQLRPGDVIAEIRVARLEGDRWSRLGAVNRNPEASMRAPTATNGPQVGAGADGGGIVAWQEPDQTGAARIWMRRLFGSTVGPPLEASPTSWEGQPVSADVDSFSLGVTEFDGARLAMRVSPTTGSALAGRLLVNGLPPNYGTNGGKLTGVDLADGGATGPFGPPAVGVSGIGGGEGHLSLAFTAGAQVQVSQLTVAGALTPPQPFVGPPAVPQSAAVTSIAAAGGDVVAYPAFGPAGEPTVAVRQEYSFGEVQAGIVSAASAGPISSLSLSSGESGDSLVAFLEGEAGAYELVGARVSVAPAEIQVKAPKGWVRPAKANVSWVVGAGGLRNDALHFDFYVDGHAVRRGLSAQRYRPRPTEVGNGISSVRVLATNGLGDQVLSKPEPLRVDGEPPDVTVRAGKGRKVRVTIADRDSGLRGSATRIDFGGGKVSRGKSRATHVYPGPGIYSVSVRAGDRAGNEVARRFRVRVR
jgi:hypothetical protein